jgi:AmmeMemoRadiSam system protein B
MIRKPAVAGQFYPGNARQLAQEARRLISLRQPARPRAAIAVVCPHAGYIYSGGVAGQVLGAVEIPPSVVLIGPDHFGEAQDFSVFDEGAWETPMGRVEVDAVLTRALLDSSPLFSADCDGHRRDHCLEVQLPLLQTHTPPPRIAPILVGTLDEQKLREAGEAAGAAIETMSPRPLLLASSDLNHYEPLEISEAKDRRAIQAMLKLDEALLMRECLRHHITMCGIGAAYLTIVAAKRLGASRAELIDYRTSADAGADADSVVGYAGIVFW